jgi:predicted DNA-binding ribbon-helix-helix protein
VSDDTAAPGLPVEGFVRPLSVEDFEPEFRVVARGGVRRGIRLERLYWSLLKQLAEKRRSTIGLLIDEIAALQAETANLTSAIRVACLRWLADENADLRKLASLQTVNGILAACPSPAFALSSTKKILAFNAAFQNLVKRQLPIAAGEDARQDLKLALDVNVAEIFSRLEANGNSPVMTGFVIGVRERRYRGQINAVKAPVIEPDLLLAYVFGS